MSRFHIGRRTVAGLAALVLAAIATIALIGYVQEVRAEALAEVAQVEVLVAKQPIPVGTSTEDAVAGGMIGREAVPGTLVPVGAIGTLDDIEGLVATVDLVQNEPLLRARFAAVVTGSPRLRIPEGHEAISVAVTIPPGVAGFIRGGDLVSVIASIDQTVEKTPAAGDEAAATAFDTGPLVKYLLHNVPVIAIGQHVVTEEAEDGRIEEQTTTVLATFAVTPSDAEKLAFAALHGDLYLTLVPLDQEPVPTTGRTLDNIFDE